MNTPRFAMSAEALLSQNDRAAHLTAFPCRDKMRFNLENKYASKRIPTDHHGGSGRRYQWRRRRRANQTGREEGADESRHAAQLSRRRVESHFGLRSESHLQQRDLFEAG